MAKILIANVSHDLRTLPTMIAGYAEMMRDIPGENSPENAEIILAGARRLTALVNDLLELSKRKADAGRFCFQKFCVTETVRTILYRFQKFAATDGCTLELEAEESLWVVGNERKIRPAVYNLAGNGLNYTGADRTVTVRQKRAGPAVRIEVVDTGEGIPPDDLPHIFERYYRLSRTHRRPATGTGPGLSIVKPVLDAHEGAQYGVESVRGQRSVFWFTLPLADEGKP